MSADRRLSEWLDIRPSEFRALVLSFVGAFVVMSFGVLSGAMRDAFYLGLFDADTLPYVLFASVSLGLPAVAVFSHQMVRRAPHVVMRSLIGGVSAGLLVLYGLVMLPTMALDPRIAAVVFYLWTVVAVLLLTSGFWIIVSEIFAVREAKRLFGLISAGGALGTLMTGISVSFVLSRIRPVHTVPLMVAVLAVALLTFEAIPRDRLRQSGRSREARTDRRPARIRALVGDQHLRLVAAIVLLTSAASYIVGWQMQEAIQVSAKAGVALDGMAGASAVTEVNRRIGAFMGAFRGWTGGLAFVIQVFLAGRVLAGAGIAWSLAILPLALLAGSAGILVAPGLLTATLVRGADNTFGKSLYRTVAELLWVPIPSEVRRRTKAFVSSMVDNAGEGLGALMVLLWVTVGGFPSRYLAVGVSLICLVLLYLSRAMGAQYFATLRARLDDSRTVDGMLEVGDLGRGDRLGATLTRLDISRVFATTGVPLDPANAVDLGRTRRGSSHRAGARSRGELLQSGDPVLVEEALADLAQWTVDEAPALIRLLAREAWLSSAGRNLADIGQEVVPRLRSVLLDESADFVIRRRIPRVLARISDPEADQALIDALQASRFEVRYRVALALRRRRLNKLAEAPCDWQRAVWEAVRAEVSRDRPVWELARLLDAGGDDFVERHVGLRGELSLEHTFRLLSLVLDADTIRAAYHGIIFGDPEVKSLAQEYLEQVLPADVRTRLWPFIGDLSAFAERRAIRQLDDVVADLLKTGATLFASPEDREALQRYLKGDEES